VGVNVPDAILVGRFSGDTHWPLSVEIPNGLSTTPGNFEWSYQISIMWVLPSTSGNFTVYLDEPVGA
jgi:hypothetical protein